MTEKNRKSLHSQSIWEEPDYGRYRNSLYDWFESIKNDPKIGEDAAAAWLERAIKQMRS